MAGVNSIQFWGKESVLQAYEASAIDAWAVFQGKNLLTAGCGKETLSQWLDMLATSGGLYTLKVYRGIENTEDINDAEPANGSFNFKLLENPGIRPLQAAPVSGGTGGVAGVIQKKLEAKVGAYLDRCFEKMNFDGLDDDDEEQKPQTIGGVLMGLLDEPAKIPELINGIRALMQGFGGGQLQQPQPAYIPQYPQNYPQPQQMAGAIGSAMTDEVKYSRIGAAIETMEKADPDIVVHLEKLAQVSVTNPEKFKGLLSMLSLL